MRRLTLLMAVAACAQQGAPPGGPPDVTPPKLVHVRPDSNARNVRIGGVSFEFDEVISERPQGATSLADVVEVSPSAGAPNVAWHRNTITVTPRGGYKPNTTYTVRLRPGITDLENNVDSAGTVVVFSTGAEIATAAIRGIVFDWTAARPAPASIVEAIGLPDSATYSTTADSLGGFSLGHLPSGRYLLMAFVDQNRNRQRDTRELFDSVTITLADSLRREMLAAVRDSLGPAIANVEARDTMSVRVTFDRGLDTALALTPALFTLRAADSSQVLVQAVLTPKALERLAADSARARAVQDSLRAAFLVDSIRRADSASAGVPPARPTGRRPGAQTAPPPAAGPDTVKPREIVPRAQIPLTSVVLQLGRTLAPGVSYRLRANELRGVTGATRSSDRVFQGPRRAPKDTTSVKPDTGTVRRE